MLTRIRGLFSRQSLDREMNEEMGLHLDLRADDLVKRGMSRPDAMRQARLEFGNVTAAKERAREVWRWTWIEQIAQDLRYAARGLRRSPLFTAVAVLSLGLGIGTNAAVFGLVSSVLLTRLPVPHASELVLPVKASARMNNPGFSFAEYQALRESPGLGAVRTTALFGIFSVPIEVGAARDDAAIDLVDGSYFTVLGLQPLRGRPITDEDQRAGAPVVEISTNVWRGQFGGAEDVVGKTMKIRGVVFTVIGVLPEGFHGLSVPDEHDLVAPLTTGPLLGTPNFEATQVPGLLIVGRLANPAVREQTAHSMDELYQRCCAAGQMLLAFKGPPAPVRIVLQDISHGFVSPKFDFRATFGRVLILLMCAVAGVLLIVCANVGSLLLGRATSRRRELAVRLSLGASRARLARQLFAESLLLGILGAGLGLALAAAATRELAHNLPGVLGSLSGLVAFRLDATMLAFTGGASVLAVLLFGTLPAWRATRTDLIAPLKEGSLRNARTPVGLLDRGIIVVQVALTLALVAASGLLAATLRNLEHVDPQFATRDVASAWLDTRQTPLAQTGVAPITEDLLARMRAIPGVRSAAMALSAPQVGGRRSLTMIQVPGYAAQTGEDMRTETNEITPDFFAAAGIPVRSGRAFTSGDAGGATRVAIVNQAFVHDYLAGREALGAAIRFGGDQGPLVTIVGVVGDARYADLRVGPPPMVYRPMSQMGMQEVGTLVVRGASGGDAAALAAAMRTGIMSAAPRVQLRNITTVEEAISQTLSRERLAAAMGAVFGAIALALAVVGLYGVVSYTVARRTNEIGIRMALGAGRAGVVWRVFRSSLTLVAIGVAIGLPLAFVAGRAMASQLWGVGAGDPVLLALSVCLLAAAATVASIVPALRAARVDPLMALRAE